MVGNSLVKVLAFAAGLVLFAACGGGDSSHGGAFAGLDDLDGHTIGVASLASPSTLQTRFVLLEGFALDSGTGGTDVTVTEAATDSLVELLQDGEIDAIVLPPHMAYRFESSDDLYVLSHIADEMQGLTKTPVLASMLVSYPDVVESRGHALHDVNSLLTEAGTYLTANRADVLAAMAEESELEEGYLAWLLERQEPAFGVRSNGTQEEVISAWNAGLAVGDIEELPDLADVMLPDDVVEDANGGDRVTVSIALLDDPARRAALYPIERGLVTSESVDLDITFLPQGELTEAAAAKQYDIIEAAPLVVPIGAARGLDFVVVSAGVRDVDSTLLFVLAANR